MGASLDWYVLISYGFLVLLLLYHVIHVMDYTMDFASIMMNKAYYAKF